MPLITGLQAPAATSDFGLKNLPLGVFTHPPSVVQPRCCTRLGDVIIDLAVLEEAGLFQDVPGLAAQVFCQATANAFIAHSRSVWVAFRQRLTELLSSDSLLKTLDSNAKLQEAAFHLVTDVELHLPLQIGDYTDFYASREHATNVGTMFRGKDNALQPNWLHLPVGYHGRASTVVVSGTPVRRPCGQLQKDNADPTLGSIHAPCKRLDFELEMAAVVGGPSNPMGQPLTIDQAKDRIFGFMLMNDWSARDIQKWEYVPLGPFTSKNFATTVSPWIIMSLALDNFATPTSAGTQEDPVPLTYLQDPSYSSFDVDLTVAIKSDKQDTPAIICRSNLASVYWTAAQQLAHHSVTGCSMKPGDLLGSGTISGSQPDSFGSLLELSWNGTKEVDVGGEKRLFLNDGDTVIMEGRCEKPGVGSIGFGECSGLILPALSSDIGSPPSSLADQSSPTRYAELKLYSYWRSSSTWRVRIAIAAKGLDVEIIPVNLLKGEHKTVEFLAKNPLGQLPCLECTDSVWKAPLFVTQSVAIIEFLDKAFPTRRQMFPADPSDRAAALEMVELINAGTQPLQNINYLRALEVKSGGKLNANHEAGRAIEYGLLALETLVRRRLEFFKGPYCLGTFSPSVVDAFLVPQMYNARRFDVDVDSICPTLTTIETLCLHHPWFVASHPNSQPDVPDEEDV